MLEEKRAELNRRLLAARRQEVEEKKRLQAEGDKLQKALEARKENPSATEAQLALLRETVLNTRQDMELMRQTLQRGETHRVEFENVWNNFVEKSAKDVDQHVQTYIQALDEHINKVFTPEVVEKIVKGVGGDEGDGDGDGDDDKKGKKKIGDSKGQPSQEHGQTNKIKLKLPWTYNGKKEESVLHWAATIETYVYGQRIPYWDRVLMATSCMGGDAMSFAISLQKEAGCSSMVEYSQQTRSIPGKDNLLLTFEEGGVETISWDQVDYGLDEPNRPVAQEGSYAAVAARGGGRQGRGCGRGRGRDRGGRGFGTQRGGGEGSHYVGGRGNGPSHGGRGSYSTWGRGRGSWYNKWDKPYPPHPGLPEGEPWKELGITEKGRPPPGTCCRQEWLRKGGKRGKMAGNQRQKTILGLLMLLLLDEENHQIQQKEMEEQIAHEREVFEDEYRRRKESLYEEYRRHMEELADAERTELLHRKRVRYATAAFVAAIAKSECIRRKLWQRARSQAWWDRCCRPSFTEFEFRHCFRMGRRPFEYICDELAPIIAKQDTMLRAAIPVNQRVAVCLWRLATGEPLRSVSKRFGLGISTCSIIMLDVCNALNRVLLPRHIQWPSPEQIPRVTVEFESMHGLGQVIGAVYTTHIPIIAPKLHTNQYLNKRQTEQQTKPCYTIILQGVVDSKGAFTDVCVGWPGSYSDSQVLQNSALYQTASAEGGLHDLRMVGGYTYPLSEWLLTPYSGPEKLSHMQQMYNEKLMGTLMTAKVAFGRLKGRWRFLTKRSEVKVQEMPAVIGACCVLHNICVQYHEPFDDQLLVPAEEDLEGDIYSGQGSVDALEKRDEIAQAIADRASTLQFGEGLLEAVALL
ncbi:hypothetical protein CBR_g46722 [Chara braunii]|uniref:DDE Tnp4 domain-containing protein n=1 Tax=Chara braunii TaxID=69332 RepID=A0A388K3Z7_CHABU|nr:hypothetical protein CBR_g46722 [Chara braunii]|eukprot:GBG64765.1 hypothetical protein CBR_g46722 [Chara braunii]